MEHLITFLIMDIQNQNNRKYQSQCWPKAQNLRKTFIKLSESLTIFEKRQNISSLMTASTMPE